MMIMLFANIMISVQKLAQNVHRNMKMNPWTKIITFYLGMCILVLLTAFLFLEDMLKNYGLWLENSQYKNTRYIIL